MTLAPDLVLLDGRVRTVDAHDGTAEALAIFGGRIVAVGKTRAIADMAGRRTRRIDLGGRTVLPGLIDPHVHLADWGTEELHKLDCRDFYTNVASVGSIVERIALHAKEVPQGQWIVAHGSPMQDFRMPEGRYPDRADLDRAAPHHPTIMNFGAHVSVANSRALSEAGVDAATPSPKGGHIETDPETGALTGRLYERAQFLVRFPIGTYTLEQKKAGILDAAAKCLARGVSAVHDIVMDGQTARAYHELARDGLLPIRVTMLVRVIESRIARETLLNLGVATGFGGERLRLGGVKMSIDGGATGRQAAFSAPYADDPCHHGLIRIQSDELEETAELYHRAGHQLCIHAMGDVAMDMALDALVKVIERHPRADHRHRIEHMGNWMVDARRLDLMRTLGILPVPNIAFAHYIHESLLAMMGPERMAGSFNFRTLMDAGFPLTTGSDGPYYWPVDVLRDIGLAVARRTRSGASFAAEEALGVDDAIRMATRNAAFASFDEARMGSIEIGKLADLAVLAEDPSAVAPERIKDIDVDLTIVGGDVVFAR